MRLFLTVAIIFTTVLSAFSQPYLKNTVLVRFKSFHSGDAELNQLLSNENAHIARRILPLKASLKYGKSSLFKSANNDKARKILKAEEPLLRTYVVKYDNNIDAKKFCYYLKAKYDQVEIAEPYYLQKMQGYTPNDPAVSNQETLLKQIKAPEAWEIEKGDSNIVIAVSDNAIQQSHPDLNGNIATNTAETINGIDDDGNGYVDDYQGYNIDGGNDGQSYWDTFANSNDNHGTMTSGIAGADFDNNVGAAGIGGRSKIFPIRIGSVDIGSQYTAYGYESIVYAAVRQFKVLSCSWGETKPYSELEQSIVSYALARDVAVIAAAGNLYNQDQVSRFYPAGYKGVLGVGVVTNIDTQDPISILGSQCRIMSPGAGNYTTDLDFGQQEPYTYTESYTSFATPVVAGAVAIARAKHPELNAEQVIEFVRQSTDDISGNFGVYKKLIPGRLNMLKIVTTNPMTTPGIVIDDIKFFDHTGARTDRFFAGDTVYVQLTIRNVLGNASNLNFDLSLAYPNSHVITLLDGEQNSVSINTNQTITLDKFAYVIDNPYSENITLRLDITGEGGYKDFILFDYANIPALTTFENDRIKFSIGDLGTFGYAVGKAQDYRDGFGFIDKNFGDALYEGGVFITENEENLITSFEFGGTKNQFTSLKRFYNPKTSAAMMTNGSFSNTFARLDQSIELPKHSPWVRIKLDLTDSLALGSRYSIGYYFDWDIGVEYQYAFNTTGFLPDSKPENIPLEKYASVYTGNSHFSQVFGAAIYSDENDAIAQAGGYNGGTTNLNTNFMINSLEEGQINASSDISDMFNIIGMRFSNDFDTYETKTCYLCVAAGADKAELSHYLKECASGITSVEMPIDKSVVYNSAEGLFQINNPNYVQSEIYALNGAKIFDTNENSFTLKELNQGIYFVRIEFKDRYLVKKVSVLR